MTRLDLSLLGGFQARLQPGPPLALPTRKAQALLAYLAVPPGRAHPRGELAALLWGEAREESARASLRQALFAIRKAIGDACPSALVLDDDTLALDASAVCVDVAAFERLMADGGPAALEEASTLYRGDFLAGFSVAEPAFEEWLVTERERLRELALEGLAKLLGHQRRMAMPEAAIQTALRLLALDPLQEPVHRTLMRLYAEALRDLGRFLGDRSALDLVEAARGSAERVATLLARGMRFFDDRGFYKRAQIVPSDLALAGAAAFDDLDRLTIFADNLVPHVLRLDGLLRYDAELAAHIDSERLLPQGRAEREIRACAVHACEQLATRTGIPPRELDLRFWSRGQAPEYKAVPRHRTRTVYY